MGIKSKLSRKIVVSLIKIGFYKLYNQPLKILMYHRFMDDRDEGYVLRKSDFEKQVIFFKKNFSVLSLEDYLKSRRENNKKVRNPLIITVDDGYRNFYEYAYPVLKKHSLPATVFIPSNFIETGDWMWQDKNKYILRNTKLNQIDFEWHRKVIKLSVSGFKNLINSMWHVYNVCAPLSLTEKQNFSEKLSQSLGILLPKKPVPEFAPLSWSEIREMEENGISFGSHTVNHQILTYISEDEAKHEILESKRMLERRLGHKIESFCYPNGNFNKRIIDLIRACGYKCAVTTENGNNNRISSLFTLKRIGVPDLSDMDLFFIAIFLWPTKLSRSLSKVSTKLRDNSLLKLL